MQIVDLKEIYPSLYTPSVFLEVSDEIYAVFGVSKKTFKKAVGDLYKKRLVRLEENGIFLA